MMLNSYGPATYKRYAIAGLVIAAVTPLAVFAGDMIYGSTALQTAFGGLASPLALAAIAAPIAITGLVAGLGRRHDSLSRQITSERAEARQLRQAAYHDSLTGLRNRHALSEDMDRTLNGAGDNASQVTLLLFDLDRFKFVNDTLGHAVGDAVLKALADRLKAYNTAKRTVYRLGGDEFVIVWQGAQTQDAVAQFCEDLARNVFRPVSHGAGAIETAGSIGISLSEAKGAQLSDLLKTADLALYRAKSRPGTSHCFFSQDMDTDYRERREVESAMREGVATGAFRIEYLPVIKADTMKATGFKARLRWKRPGHGDVAQDIFLPMAERTGLIVLIGKWMLHQAFSDAMRWEKSSEITLPVSAIQLQDPGFAPLVLMALVDAGMAPERLVLDVRSNASIGNCPVALTNLEILRAGGISISVSEFAASVAGLSMTRPYPVDRVSLDLNRIKAIAGETMMPQMLNLFLQLAATVGTPVTLSGVDNEEDLKIACAAGPAAVQGEFAGAPLNAETAQSFFSSADDVIQFDSEKGRLRKAS